MHFLVATFIVVNLVNTFLYIFKTSRVRSRCRFLPVRRDAPAAHAATRHVLQQCNFPSRHISSSLRSRDARVHAARHSECPNLAAPPGGCISAAASQGGILAWHFCQDSQAGAAGERYRQAAGRTATGTAVSSKPLAGPANNQGVLHHAEVATMRRSLLLCSQAWYWQPRHHVLCMMTSGIAPRAQGVQNDGRCPVCVTLHD
jgi:hypothetical protein